MAHIELFSGSIRSLPDSGRPTGIYKQPVTTRVEIGRDGLLGDTQADRRVHGGPDKAVHLYPAGHYRQLAEHFAEAAEQLLPGSLGENISTDELDEYAVHIGDIYRLGSARLQICQPRNPCWKIDERFATEGIAAFIAEHRLTGWYWRVLTPGQAEPFDQLLLELEATNAMTLAEALRLCQTHRPPLADLASLAATPGIARDWQEKIEKRLAWLRIHAAEPVFSGRPGEGR